MPNYRESLIDRILINQKAEQDQSFRRDILAKCKSDPVFWCNNFAFTYDPRLEFAEVQNLPFILWPKQIEYLDWLNYLLTNKEDGAIEKSRDTGVSYTTLIPFILHHWLFDDFSAKIGSRKEDYVDTPGDLDSLFEKIVYNIRRLPKWMLPEGFDINTHKTYMKLIRPDNNNTITGESANESFARGGRQNFIMFDEHAFWPFAEASWESAGETTPTRLSISTPPRTGKASFFYKNLISGRVKRFSFHYKSDPRKDLEWEKKQREKKSDEEFERELNISYEGSTKGTVYAAQYNLCDFGSYPYDPQKPLFVGMDYGLDGVAIQWWQWDYKYDKWTLIDSYYNEDKEIKYYIPFLTGDILGGFDYSQEEVVKINEHRKWRKDATFFGDPDVKKRSLHTKNSTADIFRQHGIIVQSKPWAGRTHLDLKQQTILFLKKVSINEDNADNEFFGDCIRSARYPEKSETSQATTGVSKPIHDWTSHHRTALEYFADNAPTRYTPRKEYSSNIDQEIVREERKRRQMKFKNPITGW